MTITNSAILFNAFMAGPEALGAVDDAVLTDQTALEDLHTVLGGMEANLVLEGGAGWDAAVLRGQVAALGNQAIFGARDPARVRETLRHIVAGMERIPQDGRDRALARTRRVMLFDTPAAVRETAQKVLEAGDRSGPAATPRLTAEEIEAFFEPLGNWGDVKRHALLAMRMHGLVLHQFVLETDEAKFLDKALRILIERAAHPAYLHHLSLLATHSPELFENQHIEAMRAEAERIHQESILQRDITARRRMVQIADRLTALADQLQRQLEAK